MGTLRKVLFLHAALFAVLAVWLVAFPRSVVGLLSPGYTLELGGAGGFVPLFATPTPVIPIMRLLGVLVLAVAMFMVLVAQKIEAVWWWSWAFVIADAAIALIVLLHLVAGLPPASSSLPWWLIVIASLGLVIGVLWGLFKAQQDQPIIEA